MKTFVSTPLTLRVVLSGVYGDLNLHLWSIKCCNRGIEASQYLSPIQGASHLSAKQEDLGSFSLLGLFRYFRELHFSLHWRAGGLCNKSSWKSEGQRLKLLFFCPSATAWGVFIINGGSAVAAQICSPACVNETFFSKLLRFLIADCTRVTKLTQGSSMHAQ